MTTQPSKRITKTLQTLQARDDTSSSLPTLSTTTTSAQAITATTDSSPSMPTFALPKISVTTSTTSQSWATPTITPPSASDNPNVWRSSAPAGTVFIAVGAVAGFFLLCFIVFLFIRKLLAHENAKHSLSFDSDSDDSFMPLNGNKPQLSNKISNPFHSSASKGESSDDVSEEQKYPALYDRSDYNDSVTNVSSDAYLKQPEGLYSTLETQSANNLKRKSMFVSPTAQVMQLKAQPSMSTLSLAYQNSATNGANTHTRVYSNVNSFGTNPNDSTSQFSQNVAVPAQRMNNHRRDTSYDSLYLQSPERSLNRSNGKINRNVPSVYLDAMFEDDD